MNTFNFNFLQHLGFNLGQFYKTEVFFEKLSKFQYISSLAPFANYFFFRRDALPVGAARDTICTNITGVCLTEYPFFKGFCKVTKQKFLEQVDRRTVQFERHTKKILKATAIEAQLQNSPFAVNRTAYKRALARVREHLKISEARLEPQSIEESVLQLKVSAGAGYPYFVKKAHVLIDLLLDTAFFTSEQTSDNFAQLFYFPTYVAYRVQQRPSGVKLRLIYVYPGVITVCEQLFLGPIVKFFQGVKTPYVIGETGLQITRRWSDWQKYSFQVSIDWTGFDWFANSYVIKDAFGILKSMFVRMDSKNSAIFDLVSFFFIFTPIYTTNPKSYEDEIVFKRRGVPSGSSFTNVIDTIVNLIVTYYFFELRNIHLKPEQVACLGDDIVIALNKRISLDEFAKVSLISFGMLLSIEKSFLYKRGEKVYFLGGLITSSGRYIDPETALYQICTTTSDLFIKCKTSSEHFVRCHDKICSVLFKYTDGHLLYDYLVRELIAYLGVEPDTESYTEVFSRATVPIGIFQKVTRNTEYMRTFGWMIQ